MWLPDIAAGAEEDLVVGGRGGGGGREDEDCTSGWGYLSLGRALVI